MKNALLMLLATLLASGCMLGPALEDGARFEDEVRWTNRTGDALDGRLFLPAGAGPHSAVLLIHGGGWAKGEPSHMDHIGRLLANQGFVAFSTRYRLAPEHQWQAQLRDVQDAWAWLAARPDTEAWNIALWGYSAGAHLALLTALAPELNTAHPELPRPIAAVGGGSPTQLDLFDPESELVVDFLGGTLGQVPEAWRDASPIHWVSRDDPAIYLYHGTSDSVVDLAHARRLADDLQAADVPVILDAVSGGHIAVALLNRDTERRSVDFIRQQRRDADGMFDATAND